MITLKERQMDIPVMLPPPTKNASTLAITSAVRLVLCCRLGCEWKIWVHSQCKFNLIKTC